MSDFISPEDLASKLSEMKPLLKGSIKELAEKSGLHYHTVVKYLGGRKGVYIKQRKLLSCAEEMIKSANNH